MRTLTSRIIATAVVVAFAAAPVQAAGFWRTRPALRNAGARSIARALEHAPTGAAPDASLGRLRATPTSNAAKASRPSLVRRILAPRYVKDGVSYSKLALIGSFVFATHPSLIGLTFSAVTGAPLFAIVLGFINVVYMSRLLKASKLIETLGSHPVSP
jgi:hypothetical protein